MPLDMPLIKDMTAWRQHLHRHPECGFDLPLTSNFIAEKLESFGIETVRGIGHSGIVGVLRNGSSDRSVGLRADMDALLIVEESTTPNRSVHDRKMHACGHDGHSAMLLGAAAHLAKTKNFNGTVHFIFQPDEEHGAGAQAMIDDGLFERFAIDEVYGLHNMPDQTEGTFTVRPGSLMASESSFEIRVTGIGGHAAMPHRGVDPIVVGSQIILALQTIVSRNLSVTEETAVISATEFITNGTVNVIPSEVVIKGDCRCFTDHSLAKIRDAMERIVAGTCQAAGAAYEFNFKNTFHSTINSADQTTKAINAARAVFGADNVVSECAPLTISEDFSSMLRVKPGCYALIGNGTGEVGGCALHNPSYDFNDRILAKGAEYWVQLVEDILG